jgi:hypothetical protein
VIHANECVLDHVGGRAHGEVLWTLNGVNGLSIMLVFEIRDLLTSNK